MKIEVNNQELALIFEGLTRLEGELCCDFANDLINNLQSQYNLMCSKEGRDED